MGRIITTVTLGNTVKPEFSFKCDALVGTGAAQMVLPVQWKERLGPLQFARKVELELGNQRRAEGEVCGPVRLQIEGFPPVFGEVLLVQMDPVEGGYEPMLGYIPLEASQAAVDMVGHRLVYVKKVDLK
jgi:hypothetical protein